MNSPIGMFKTRLTISSLHNRTRGSSPLAVSAAFQKGAGHPTDHIFGDRYGGSTCCTTRRTLRKGTMEWQIRLVIGRNRNIPPSQFKLWPQRSGHDADNLNPSNESQDRVLFVSPNRGSRLSWILSLLKARFSPRLQPKVRCHIVLASRTHIVRYVPSPPSRTHLNQPWNTLHVVLVYLRYAQFSSISQ